MPQPVPSLSDVLADPSKATQLPREAIAMLLGELEQIKAQLWSRLIVAHTGGESVANNGDNLLDVNQAALKLGMSKDYLYRNAAHLPFTVRVGKKHVRFSEIGIDRFIRQRMGR